MIYRGKLTYHDDNYISLYIHEYCGRKNWEIVCAGDDVEVARDLPKAGLGSYMDAIKHKKPYFYYCGRSAFHAI